jgi:hypothetical protein
MSCSLVQTLIRTVINFVSTSAKFWISTGMGQNVRILASIRVPVGPALLLMPNLALVDTK